VPLNLILVACHRFKRIQVDPLCLSEILISEYAVDLRVLTSRRSLVLNPDLRKLAATHALQRVTYATAPPGLARGDPLEVIRFLC